MRRSLFFAFVALLVAAGCGGGGNATGFQGEMGGGGGGGGGGSDGGGTSCQGDACVATPPPGSDAGRGDASKACPHVGPPVVNPSSFPSCSTDGGAHCVPSSQVPASEQALLALCATGYCVPDVFIASGGAFVLATCTSIDNAEGRCLHVSVPEVAQEATYLPQSTCASYERCVPCYSPLDGTATGVCKLSCDPGPKDAKVVFAGCCSTQGKCVPTADVPAAEQASLSTDTCKSGTELCVPTEMLQPGYAGGTMCSGNITFVGNYTGVCLSNCLNFGSAQGQLDQGNCDSQHTCVPCTDPTSGNPTHAPGCP